jgi:diacylglycerol kinase (ATP)
MTTTRPLRIAVAINPSASFGKGRPVGPACVAALEAAGHEVTALTRSSHADLLAAAAAALADGAQALVVVGGDGMVSLGTGLVAQTGIPLGIVPSGTGNDMARALGIAHDDPQRGIEQLVAALEHPARRVDALRVTRADGGTTWVAGTVSAGFDAFVNERANAMRRPRGRLRYDIALGLELLRLRQVDYDLDVDGTTSTVAGTLVSVGSARSVGGGIALLPDAVVDDGELDLLVVERLTRRTFLRLFPRVAKGTHGTDPRVRLSRATTVRIDAPGVVAYGDGERIGPLPVTVEVVPGALAVLAAAGSAGHSG